MQVTVTLYGFNGCDTVRKARKWLDAKGVAHEFFDYRKQRLDPESVDGWFSRAGWEAVFNRNSIAFRELPEDVRAGVDAARAKVLIMADTNLIKRPVLDTGETLLFGFKADAYAQALGG